MATFTTVYHRKPYAAIDPAAPQNSMQGRSVLIAGATGGVGSQPHMPSSKHRLPPSPSSDAASQRSQQPYPSPTLPASKLFHKDDRQATGHCKPSSSRRALGRTEIRAHPNRHANPHRGCHVHDISNQTPTRHGTLLPHERDRESAHGRRLPGARPADGKSHHQRIHHGGARFHGQHHRPGGVGCIESGCAAAFQAAADCIPAAECFVLNVHPGAVLTSAARENRWDENTIFWGDSALPGSFFVWASTKQARDTSLHGRFVWCNWDVSELVAMKQKIEADPGFLRIGLQGFPSLNIMETFAEDRGNGRRKWEAGNWLEA